MPARLALAAVQQLRGTPSALLPVRGLLHIIQNCFGSPVLPLLIPAGFGFLLVLDSTAQV